MPTLWLEWELELGIICVEMIAEAIWPDIWIIKAANIKAWGSPVVM